jgi:hypothetical protein
MLAETLDAARDAFRYSKKHRAPPLMPPYPAPARTVKSTGRLAID